MPLRIMVSRHSAFYSPLICTVANIGASYSILGPGQRSHELIRDRVVDIMQSAVSSNWKPMQKGIAPLPVHFAQINRRDGFFIVARDPDPDFEWRHLEGRTVLADHGLQPLVMLKYAVHHNGVDWSKIQVVDAGSPEEMQKAFEDGVGEYLHRQAPGAGQTIVSVGASMPEVAFSSLCTSREFTQTAQFTDFLTSFRAAREWVQHSDPLEVAAKEAAYFPGIERDQLADAIRRYQKIGCWTSGIEIPRALYDQALNVFEQAGEIQYRAAYDEVCLSAAASS